MRHGDQQPQHAGSFGEQECTVDDLVRLAAHAIVARTGRAFGKTSGKPAATNDPQHTSASIERKFNWPVTEAKLSLSNVAVSSPLNVGRGASQTRSLSWDNLRAGAAKLGRFAAYGLALWLMLVTFLIVLYRVFNPPFSNLMLYNYLSGRDVHHRWVALDKISPAVVKAVVVAEDAQFCRHWGIDFHAIEQAIENARGRTPRGASTITMQTAKNMFLWQSKSYVRKALEVPVTILIELFWTKKRILEVYLNIAEWAPGVFGIAAAAEHHFKTTPAKLGSTAAAQLAAALPNPKVRRAGRPGPKTRRKAQVIRGRARSAGYYTRCVAP